MLLRWLSAWFRKKNKENKAPGGCLADVHGEKASKKVLGEAVAQPGSCLMARRGQRVFGCLSRLALGQCGKNAKFPGEKHASGSVQR